MLLYEGEGRQHLQFAGIFYHVQKLTNIMDHKINEEKEFVWQKPQRNKWAVMVNASNVKNKNRTRCYKKHNKWNWAIWAFLDFRLLSPLLWSERTKRLCWYKTVPGYNMWEFWFFVKHRDESSEVRKLREGKQWAGTSNETRVQLLLLDKLTEGQKTTTWRREDENRQIREQHVEK